ncbi:hypothetical protein, partial [Clostridium sp. 2-1]|uniref:hypothetical protein n=1 Tax=Clostridium sp. 2-1 TaxID=2070758 RepID=UPI001A9A3D83
MSIVKNFFVLFWFSFSFPLSCGILNDMEAAGGIRSGKSPEKSRFSGFSEKMWLTVRAQLIYNAILQGLYPERRIF